MQLVSKLCDEQMERPDNSLQTFKEINTTECGHTHIYIFFMAKQGAAHRNVMKLRLIMKNGFLRDLSSCGIVSVEAMDA